MKHKHIFLEKSKHKESHKESKSHWHGYDFNVSWLETIIGSEILEDAVQMERLDEFDNYLDSEAHMMAEEEIASDYFLENDTMDGYEDMLSDKLSDNLHNEESNDLAMYNRIMDRLNSVSSPELRNILLAKFAPEIVRGRERSMKLVARYEKKLAKAREIDARRKIIREKRNARISLKPKQKNNSNERDDHDFYRKKSSVADGYPY